jgi:hypothetical protein
MTISQLAHIPTHAALIHEEALWRTDWAGDARNAAHHLGAIGGDVAAAHREAVRLVRRHWDAIARVAAALSERGELSGDEVDALLAAGAPPRKDAAADP